MINFNKAVAKKKYTKIIDVVDNINVIEGRNETINKSLYQT